MKQRLVLFVVPILLAMPFLNRAYFVDDSYFVQIAQWLKIHPAEPYDFRADDAGLQNLGWEKDGFVRMVNPLAHHYYLAGLMKVGGEKTWWLRLGCVVLSAFSALFIFGFARRFTDNPFLATLLVLVTPVFWLTSYSLLIDSTLAFFFFGGLYFFLRLTEIDRWDFAISSGVFMGLAILSKYPGIFVLPLSAVWFIFRWGKMVKRSRAVVPWLIALLFLAGYSWYTKHVYGQAHILAASARMVNSYGWPKILSLFVFLSGSFVLPLISWLVVGRLTRLVALLIFSLCVFFFSSAFGGFSKTQAVLLGLWLVTSVLMFSVYAGLFRKWVYPRDHFVFAWVVGFMAMMIVVIRHFFIQTQKKQFLESLMGLVVKHMHLLRLQLQLNPALKN
jgi:4-amino-4-deoxy-L-arabinose transferase-like glycosyltransferase